MRLIAKGAHLGHFLRASRHMGVLYLVSTGLSFLVGIILARLLGPAGFGTYALAMSVATFAGLITEFGLPATAMRETGFAMATGEWGPVKGLLRWADRIVLMLSIVLAALFAGIYLLHGDTPFLRAALWGAALIPAVAIGKLRSLMLLALGATYAGQGPQMVIRPLLFVLGTLLLWRIGGSLSPAEAMAAQVGGAAVAMLFGIVSLRRRMPAGYFAAEPVSTPRAWLKVCAPLGVSEGLRLMQSQESLLLVGGLAGPAMAGYYRVADATLQMTTLVSSTVATAATPMFARLHAERDDPALQQIVTICAWAMVGGTLLLGAPIALFGRWLIPWVFGHDFSASLPLFRTMWTGSVLAACCGVAVAVANMTGRHIVSTEALLAVVTSNALLGLLLIPHLGALGGAIASAAAVIIGAVWSNARLRLLRGIESGIWARWPKVPMRGAPQG